MDIEMELENFLGEKAKLVEAITEEFRSGTGAKAIARRVAAAFGRDQVMQYLAAVALHDRAHKALSEAGLAAAVSVWLTGIDPPREARLAIVVDPAEVTDYARLPERIHTALYDFHITLAPPRDSGPGEDIAAVLHSGEPVRLTKLQPRT